MKPSEFCPNNCVFIQDEPWVHETCWHMKDVILDPYPALQVFGKVETPVTVVGKNGNLIYIRETLSNGEVPIASVDKKRIK